ncbi:2'-5' RNA ligase family protein [Microbacterium sp. KSW2-21]|uniref:2'-5' RNA ligase family protein n=1 Tax=Microbacterium algihabitans TaxID=3075992 RepID=A0ABU3RWI3_9MICO|nr:2'-5' RNA ligase family protein [Microbacterium sp. KSW2-21]MDU0327232.1 2'-5' RNA ligase family protein [Microbacterium sp. KSW2-21]
MSTPYMTEPVQLESLQGQQYVVLRPDESVAALYRSEQSTVLARLPDGTPHPNTGHVTLRGFFEPERVHVLREFVASWASSQPPIELSVDAIDGFPPPFQVLVARLERTSSLTGAYRRLTEVLDATDFRRIGELPLEEWIFHLSLAYARSLDERAWAEQLEASRREVPSRPCELVFSVDFVWYDGDGEHIDTLPLRQ